MSGTHPYAKYIISVTAGNPTIFGETNFYVKTGPQPSAIKQDIHYTVVRGEPYTLNDSYDVNRIASGSSVKILSILRRFLLVPTGYSAYL
jgi:hypothetical protein